MSVPLLLVYEGADDVVPAGQSRAMQGALQARHKDVEAVEVKGPADHGLATPEARLATLTAIMDFLAKRNPAG